MKTSLIILAAAAALAAGCAGTPAAPAAPAATPALDCPAIAAAMGRAQDARHAAEEKGRHAWQAVIPFAVAGRYVSGQAAAAEAQQQIAQLQAQAGRQGCDAAAASS